MSDEKQPTPRWVSSDDPAFQDAVRCVMERHSDALRQLADGPTPNPLQPACCRRMVEDGWRFEWIPMTRNIVAIKGEIESFALVLFYYGDSSHEIGCAIARLLNGE